MTIERKFVIGCVLILSSQNQAPQIIIGTYRVIYHLKALSAVIRRTLLNFETELQIRSCSLRFSKKKFKILICIL